MAVSGGGNRRETTRINWLLPVDRASLFFTLDLGSVVALFESFNVDFSIGRPWDQYRILFYFLISFFLFLFSLLSLML